MQVGKTLYMQHNSQYLQVVSWNTGTQLAVFHGHVYQLIPAKNHDHNSAICMYTPIFSLQKCGQRAHPGSGGMVHQDFFLKFRVPEIDSGTILITFSILYPRAHCGTTGHMYKPKGNQTLRKRLSEKTDTHCMSQIITMTLSICGTFAQTPFIRTASSTRPRICDIESSSARS